MIRMVTQPNCPWCDRASALFDTLGLAYTKVSLDTPAKKKAFKDAGNPTVPVIYINGFMVGGHSDLVHILRTSLLAKYPESKT